MTDDKARVHHDSGPPAGANAQGLSGKTAVIPADQLPKHQPTEAELRREREVEAQFQERDARERARLLDLPEVRAYCARIAEQIRAAGEKHQHERQAIAEANARYAEACGR